MCLLNTMCTNCIKKAQFGLFKKITCGDLSLNTRQHNLPTKKVNLSILPR